LLEVDIVGGNAIVVLLAADWEDRAVVLLADPRGGPGMQVRLLGPFEVVLADVSQRLRGRGPRADLLGAANWWAPAPLRLLYDRFACARSQPPDPACWLNDNPRRTGDGHGVGPPPDAFVHRRRDPGRRARVDPDVVGHLGLALCGKPRPG
jgi:hypothetical protein